MYLVEGPLETPSTRTPRVRTAWLIETGDLAPRFITAYPYPMIAELDCVALTEDLPEHGLEAGDVGAVVHTYKGGSQFTVEFTTFNGRTVAVAKVAANQIRPLAQNEVHHARALGSVGP